MSETAKQAKATHEPNGSHETRAEARARWGGSYPPGSMYAKLNKKQRQAFTAWLKERDRDLGSMISWHREVTKVHDRNIKS